MSPLGIASTLYSLFQSVQGEKTTPASASANRHVTAGQSGDFSSSLALRMASAQAQSVNTLVGSLSSGGTTTAGFDFLTGARTGQSTDLLSLLGLPATGSGLSASGRNLSLFDPESGYQMMSVVNRKDGRYKAQFSELSEMSSVVAAMQQAGQTLVGTSPATDNESLKAKLYAFTEKYNDWIRRFDPTVKGNGVLTGTQAAEISLYELEQSVQNIFNGAQDGFHGIKDLGVSIDQSTHLATFDAGKFDSALASNRQGAVNTINEFGANFAKSAELLTATNNFIPNRLANLDRAIDYISDHGAALQAEFGRGDVAQPSAQMAKALAAYNRVFGL